MSNDHLMPDKLDRVVALMSSSRSGTSLMSSLLDGHPHILSIPNNYLWAFADFWEIHGDCDPETLVERFIEYYGLIFDAENVEASPGLTHATGAELGLTTLGENRDQILSADKDVFRKSMRRLLPDAPTVKRRLFFQAMHIAYADAIGHDVGENPIILFGLHIPHPHRVRKFLDDFPTAMFIHMIREPSQSTASQFRNYQLGGSPLAGKMMVGLINSVIGATPVVPEVKTQSRVVCLEDVHNDVKKSMINICAWLDIPFSETVLRSTYNSLKFWNEKNQMQISGVSSEYVKPRYHDYLTRFDRFRFKSLTAPRHRYFGYYSDATLLRLRIIQLLLAPILLVPFRMEWMEFKQSKEAGRTGDAVKAYVQLRLFFLKYLISLPPHVVPIYGEPGW